jgi:hypothetical protein
MFRHQYQKLGRTQIICSFTKMFQPLRELLLELRTFIRISQLMLSTQWSELIKPEVSVGVNILSSALKFNLV